MQGISKILRPSQQDQTTSYLGERLDERCRAATEKQLPALDAYLTQEVINMIKSARDIDLTNRDIAICLRRRLHAGEIHRQMLAIQLVKAVLTQCRQQVGEIYIDDILYHVALVATRTNKRMNPEFPETKRQALDLLRQYGRRGQHALQMAVRAGGGRGYMDMDGFNSRQEVGYDYNQEDVFASQNMGRPAILEGGRQHAGGGGKQLVEEVRVVISQANSFIDLMQDIILSKSSSEKTKKTDDDFEDEVIIKELIENTRKLKDKLPKMLEKLQRVPGPEAEATIFQSIEAIDVLDNSIKLHAEIMQEAKKEKTRPKVTPQKKSASTSKPQAQTSNPNIADLLSFDEGPSQSTQQPAQITQSAQQSADDPFTQLASTSKQQSKDPFLQLTYNQSQTYPQQQQSTSSQAPLQITYGNYGQQSGQLPQGQQYGQQQSQQQYGQPQGQQQGQQAYQFGAQPSVSQNQYSVQQQPSYSTSYQTQPTSQGLQSQISNTQAVVLYNPEQQNQQQQNPQQATAQQTNPQQGFNQFQQNSNLLQQNQKQQSQPYMATTNQPNQQNGYQPGQYGIQNQQLHNQAGVQQGQLQGQGQTQGQGQIQGQGFQSQQGQSQNTYGTQNAGQGQSNNLAVTGAGYINQPQDNSLAALQNRLNNIYNNQSNQQQSQQQTNQFQNNQGYGQPQQNYLQKQISMGSNPYNMQSGMGNQQYGQQGSLNLQQPQQSNPYGQNYGMQGQGLQGQNYSMQQPQQNVYGKSMSFNVNQQ